MIKGAPHTVRLSCHVPDRTVNSVRDTVCFVSLFTDTTLHRVDVIKGASHTLRLSCHVPDRTVNSVRDTVCFVSFFTDTTRHFTEWM